MNDIGFRRFSGFNRTGQPQALDRAAVTAILAEAVDVANGARDPFLIDHDCLNPAGHRFIGSCGGVVCVHCAKVAWA